jgi:hypothetical protein
MGIREVVIFDVDCDVCGQSLSDETEEMCVTRDEAVRQASVSGWMPCGDGWLCSECVPTVSLVGPTAALPSQATPPPRPEPPA